ncbi:MAG: competence protein [Flavobacteriaceae bacterium]|nr:competence protein [Flavobacteriaceae bacterium]|tara:strand:- start:44321 stop:46321 length:2001 start_codon:yes stop_codon:yes gene_type:complete
MKKYGRYVPLHFLLLYGLGIVLQDHHQLWTVGFREGLGLLVVLLMILYLAGRITRTFCSYLLFFLLGLFLTHQSEPNNSENYYQNYWQEGSVIRVRITEELRANSYNNRYYGAVVQVASQPVLGKLLLNVEKDSVTQFKVDDEIFFTTPLQDISPPKNPYDFDYRAYLKRQQVSQQVFLKSNTYLHHQKEPHTLKGYANQVRARLIRGLANQGFSEEVLSVLQALLLGQRNGISYELREGYAKAGAIHILAISGLHVGILLLLLNFLMKPLEAFSKGRILKTMLVIFLLWMFALLTGLSASVVRAVTMFSFVSIGLLRLSKTSIYHSLISSMLCLLLFKPMFLFEVGFQMSYLAVFSIVWLQPKIYAAVSIRNTIFDYFWQLLSVSVAAQVLILPLSIYYFHQVPMLFWLTNLMVIPFLGIILGGGICIMLLGWWNVQIGLLSSFLERLVGLMNQVIGWIGMQEQFLLDGLYLSESALIGSYWLIVTFLLFFQKKSYRYLVLGLLAILALQLQFFVQKVISLQKTEFMVFHKSRSSIIATRRQHQLQLLNSDEVSNISEYLEGYLAREHLEVVEQKDPSNVYFFKEQTILLVDSLGAYPSSVQNPVVLLKNSPKINLERMIKSIQPIQIVADASNYRSYAERWKETSEKFQIPFHSTSENGVYLLD